MSKSESSAGSYSACEGQLADLVDNEELVVGTSVSAVRREAEHTLLYEGKLRLLSISVRCKFLYEFTLAFYQTRVQEIMIRGST